MPRAAPEPRLWKNIASALDEMDADEPRGRYPVYRLSRPRYRRQRRSEP